MTGTILPFRPGDAEACARIVGACLAADPSFSEDLRRDLIRAESADAMRERAGLFYIAVYVLEGKPTALGGLDMNEIRMLFVDPAHQRSGIGGTLLQHLESLVPSGLFRDIFVYSALGAERFYSAHGYQTRGAHPFHYGTHLLQTIFMTKPLW